MLCHSNSQRTYGNEKFALYENSCSLSELMHDRQNIFEDENFVVDKSMQNKTGNGIVSSHCVDEDLFAGLIDASVDSSFSILDEPVNKNEIDLSGMLQGVNLDIVEETTEGNGSDKRYVNDNFSLADLYFKRKDESIENQKSQAERVKLDSEILSKGVENVVSDSRLECILSLTKNNIQPNDVVTFREKPNYTSPCVYSNLLAPEKSEAYLQIQSKKFDQEDCDELKVDLTSLEKSNCGYSNSSDTAILQGQTNHLEVVGLKRTGAIKYKNLKAKPSLFCKVLCAKVKPADIESIPKVPQTLTELLLEMDYNKYFTFDTPSPDDVVKERQKNAFFKHQLS